MRILKVISLLLDYPDQHLRDGHAELAQAIGSAREISPEQRIALRRLLDELTEGDLMDVQERYTDLFDRGRALSLLLFEHVHGESRDRGRHGRPDGAVHRGRFRNRRTRAAGLHPAVPRVPRHPR